MTSTGGLKGELKSVGEFSKGCKLILHLRSFWSSEVEKQRCKNDELSEEKSILVYIQIILFVRQSTLCI